MFEKRKDGRIAEQPVSSVATTQTPMPAEQRPVPTAPKPAGASVIGPGLAVSGNLSGKMDVVIAGQFEGTVDLPENEVRIAEGSRVRANIKAAAVEIEGQMVGDVQGTDKVVLSASGRMEGNILAPRLVLADGAKFKGSIDMDPAQPTVRPAAGQAVQKPTGGEPRKPVEVKKATA